MADDTTVETDDALDTTEPIDDEQDAREADTPPADEDAPDVEHDEREGDEQDGEDDERKPSEAAKYRRRLRETEAERDTLAATVERLQIAELHRQLADELQVPGDLLQFGRAPLPDLLNDEGQVDAGLVATAVAGLLAERPGLAKQPEMQQHPSGIGLGNRGPGPSSRTWGDVLGGN